MATDLFDLAGRVALITGSSQGLGCVIARGLAEAGAAVCLNGRDEDKLARTVQALRGDGLTARGFAFDVTDPDQVRAGVDRLEQAVGPVDVLVNNAGINLRSPLEDLALDAWRRVLETNLTAALIVSQAVAKGMIARRRGKIIHICSLMSELGRNTTGAYAASKGGLKMLTRAMATEWAKHNVQVNAIGPGYFATEMTRPLVEDEKFSNWLKARTPAGRWGDPRELVGPAVFLASAASDFVNGHVLYVDGGILAAL